MTVSKFSYPDIPYVIDRKLYDYLRQMDTIIRTMGKAIAELQTALNNQQAVV